MVKQTGKPLLETLKGKQLDTPPLWLMRQAGRYLPEYREIRKDVSSFLQMCYTPKLAAEVTLQPIRRFGFDAAILFSDILVIPDALGMHVTFEEKKGPILEKITSEKALAGLKPERIASHLSPVYEAVAEIKQQLPTHTTLIGFAGSPWTVATYMLEGGSSKEFLESKRWAYATPSAFGKLIDILIEATVEHLSLQIQAGAETVQLFDSWAGVLPEEAFSQWVIEPTRKIVEKLKLRHPAIPIIGFPRGAGFYYEAYLKQTGVDAVGLDTTIPLIWAAKQLQTKKPVQGNLDPVMLFAEKGMLRDQIISLLEALKHGPFIVNLGHGILPTTPIENVELLVETVRSWKRKQAA
ncbi:MAG: hemE [Rickettsiales bacterium]|jgi:uroporphyrinogen decarboxylase|nr:hemE [Rickettsiales bacterium]